MGRIIASVSEDYYAAARQELRAAYGEALRIERLGPDLIAVEGPGMTIGGMAADSGTLPLVFVRHLTSEVTRLTIGEADELHTAAGKLLASLHGRVSPVVALHTWMSGEVSLPYGPPDLARLLTSELRAAGHSVSPSGSTHAVSVCFTRDGLLLGYAAQADSITDWPGGRVRLARSKQQISRAEFKLEELFKLVDLGLPDRGQALDLGASPGGWTRILAARGLRVTAVDPGSLAPALQGARGVRHERMTTGEFLRRSGGDSFDVLTNDMRMEPAMSCDLMVKAADRLRTGAVAIMSLKIGTNRPNASVRTALRRLGERYDIVFARQLFHNRHEITVVGRCR